MIPTIVSCMHLNFNYIYIFSLIIAILINYCSNYCCIINSFSHCTNYFILILGRFLTDMESETSGSRGRGRGNALPPLALRRSLLESISSPPPTTDELPRGRGGQKKTGRGKAGGGRGKGRRAPAAASSPPPPADSPEHCRVDPSSDTPVHQPEVEEEATSTRTTWSPWPDQPEQHTPEGEAGAELDTTDEEEVAEGTTVYQRGGTRLPSVPATPAQKPLIAPDGET